MPLIYVIGVLIVVGVLLWLYLLQVFGLIGTLEGIKVGHISRP